MSDKLQTEPLAGWAQYLPRFPEWKREYYEARDKRSEEYELLYGPQGRRASEIPETPVSVVLAAAKHAWFNLPEAQDIIQEWIEALQAEPDAGPPVPSDIQHIIDYTKWHAWKQGEFTDNRAFNAADLLMIKWKSGKIDINDDNASIEYLIKASAMLFDDRGSGRGE